MRLGEIVTRATRQRYGGAVRAGGRWLATVVAVGTLASCYGGTRGQPNADDEGDSSSDEGGDSGADDGIPEGCDATFAPIRRLSHTEYTNTLRDLLPGAELPALNLAADPRVEGFSNNAGTLGPSTLLTRQYYEAARSIARDLDVTSLVACDGAEDGCDARFVRELGRRAFRRPLADDEVQGFLTLFEAGGDFEVGARLVVQSMLQSADFLYRPELGGEDRVLTGYEAASRLSYFLWATMPDDVLLDAAEAGELDTRAGVEAQVERMLADPKAREGLLVFHREWLDLAKVRGMLKLEEENFDDAYAASIQESAERFVWARLFEDQGSILDLLVSSDYPVDATMAALLGVEAPADAWGTAAVDPSKHAGILTHPAVLASHAYAHYPSPVLRGVFVLDRVLCTPVTPPPADVDTVLPDPDDSPEPLTNREWYHMATIEKGAQCAGCHEAINGIGYAFEHYDSMGRYREVDNGMPVDAASEALGFEFADAIDFSAQFAQSERFQGCVVDKWITYATGGTASLGGGCVQADLRQTLVDSDMSAVELIAALARHPMFSRAPVVAEEE